MQTNDEYLVDWNKQLASAKRQLDYFETGKMRWKINRFDRSDHHVAMLKRAIESIERLLATYEEA
jgi:hypothetical protein